MAFRNARALSALAVFSLALSGAFPTGAGAIDVGEAAPNFTLIDLDGFPHSLNGYASHPVLLFFLECDADIAIARAPLLESDIYEPYASRGLYVLGIDTKGCAHDELDYFRNYTGVSFPLLLDGGMVGQAYGESAGTVVLVDGGGIVRYVGEMYDAEELRAAVEITLREANNTIEETWGLIKNLYGQSRRAPQP